MDFWKNHGKSRKKTPQYPTSHSCWIKSNKSSLGWNMFFMCWTRTHVSRAVSHVSCLKTSPKTTKTWLRRQRPGPSGDTAFAKISKCLGSAQSTRGNGLSMAISPCPRTREAQKMRQCESWEKYINSSSWCSSMDKRGWGRNSVKVKVGKTLVNLYVYIYIYICYRCIPLLRKLGQCF